MTAGGRRRPPGIRPVPWTAGDALVSILGAHAALVVGGVVVMGLGGWEVGRQPIGADVAALVPFWAVGVVLAVRLGRRDGAGPAVALGLAGDGGPTSPRRRLGELVGGAVAGVATSLTLVPLLYELVHRLAGTTTTDLERPARLLVDRAGSASGIALLILSTCVAAPLVEEVIYRGVLLPALAPWGAPLAVATTSVVFGVAHLQALQLPGLVVIGVVLGTLRVSTGSLVAPIAAHVGFNATAIVVLLTHR